MSPKVIKQEIGGRVYVFLNIFFDIIFLMWPRLVGVKEELETLTNKESAEMRTNNLLFARWT